MNSDKRKICVVTSSRADYGLLYCLLKAIDLDPELVLQLIVTGMHLSHAFGYTVDRIKEDGFFISESIELLLSSNSHLGMAKATGLGVIGFSDAFKRLSPDILVVLGDRFEIFAAAITANLMNIPIAHIHGGELSIGAVDDAIRHAITKLAHLHFPTADIYRRRILQMGESEASVFNFGAPGLDRLALLNFKSASALESELGITFSQKYNFLITLHSTTRSEESAIAELKVLISALSYFAGGTLIFTAANCDAGGQVINDFLKEYVSRTPSAYFFEELGLENYLCLVNQVDLVIGNSSSGLIEVPCLKKPAVNIGARQDGRIRTDSVIDVLFEKDAIISAVKKGLSKTFLEATQKMHIPFFQKQSSVRIKNVLKEISVSDLVKKEFHDLAFERYAVMSEGVSG